MRGTTRTVGVIGWPVAHSFSPAMHNAAFEAMGLDWVYVALPVRPGAMAAALDGLVALGFAGVNVTMPHKVEAADRCDELSDDARRLGAVNTIAIEAGRRIGHNTDAPGFHRFLSHDARFDATARSAVILGAGGAARAVALSLARAGLGELTVAARDPAAVDPIAGALEGLPTAVRAVAFDGARDLRPDLVVNATPLGAEGEELPLPQMGADSLAVDLIYRSPQTTLLRTARAAGATAFGGLGLLLHQAAAAFELWTGSAPPLAVMSAAAVAQLAEPPS